MKIFNIEKFISANITHRARSLFADDILSNKETLTEELQGKSILVIGGAGTIGSSFIKAILKFSPAEIVVADTNENGLTELVRDIRSSDSFTSQINLLTYPIDFGSRIFKKILIGRNGFDVVANFAAHKHVRSEKDVFSIEAMIENNVVKAKALLDLLLQFPPKHFFCVSTDKAANPVNIMGASKKLMEEVIMTYKLNFKVTTARFANVAFSNGSLLYGFIERLSKGQPLAAPNDVKRYFVSPEESGELCMLACILGNTGEIFFPKLDEGEMQTFSDIADKFLAEYGYSALQCETEALAKQAASEMTRTSKSYPVLYFESNTDGEKHFEEFFTKGEPVEMDRFLQLGVVQDKSITNKLPLKELIANLDTLFAKNNITKAEIIHLLQDLIPNFEHINTGKNLDSKM